jgi:hypothetical protein
MWYFYAMKFYSAIKKSEILLFEGKCMELRNIILMKLARLRKLKAACFLSYVEYRPNMNTSSILKNERGRVKEGSSEVSAIDVLPIQE